MRGRAAGLALALTQMVGAVSATALFVLTGRSTATAIAVLLTWPVMAVRMIWFPDDPFIPPPTRTQADDVVHDAAGAQSSAGRSGLR